MIEPRRDAYGPEADTSNLADYLDLLALAGTPLRRAELADYLAEQNWVVRSRELFHDRHPEGQQPVEDDEDGGAEAAPSELGADDVFELLSARAAALGNRYPFVRSETELVADSLEAHHRPYLCLLAITVAHHYHVTTAAAPERVFETVVADVMTARGLTTVDTGQAGRGEGDFRELVRAVADRLGLIAAPDSGPSREHANEEGVDIVSHLPWGDPRAGHWVFIGQATCGRSGSWQAKIMEPSPPQWAALLSCVVHPVPYLAVPHHVEDKHLLDISFTATRMVLDRLRLTRHLGPLSIDQEALLEAVSNEDVYHPLR